MNDKTIARSSQRRPRRSCPADQGFGTLQGSCFRVWMRSSGHGRGRSLQGTSTKCAGPAARDACSARAKQVSAQDRSAFSEVVRSRQAADRHSDARIAGRAGAGARSRLLTGCLLHRPDQRPASGEEQGSRRIGRDSRISSKWKPGLRSQSAPGTGGQERDRHARQSGRARRLTPDRSTWQPRQRNSPLRFAGLRKRRPAAGGQDVA
jgi:hypothetical protein